MLRSSSLFYLLMLCLLSGLIAGGVYIERLNQAYYEVETRSRVQEHLFAARNRLENRLNSDMQLAKGLIAVIATTPDLDQGTFSKAASILLQHDTQLTGVSAAPDMVVTLVYPYQRNAKAVGLDLREQPAQFEAADMARMSGEIVLAGPVKLVQGGKAFIARMPVYLQTEQGSPYFWGLVSALLDTEQLFINSAINNSLPIEIAIQGSDAKGGRGEVFFGRAELFEQQPVVTEMKLPVGAWRLAAVPRGELLSPIQHLWPARIIYAVVAVMVWILFWSLTRSLRTATFAQRQAESEQHTLAQLVERLNDRERLLRTVIDQIPDALVLKDNRGKFLLGNQAVAKLYNTSPGAMIGKDDGDFGVPEYLSEQIRQTVLEVLSSGQTKEVMEQSRDAISGEIRHYRSIKKPFKDTAGNDQVLVIAHDITDLLHMQERLRESETKLRTILDNVAACIYLKDHSGRYLFANSSARRFWGVGSEEVIGFTDESFFEPESAAQIIRNDRVVLDQGETISTEETLTIAHTGQTYIYQSTKLPLTHQDGSIYALCGISVDITDIKKIQTALQESEQRFKMAGQAAYDLIYEWDVATDSLTWFGDVDKILGAEPGEVSHHLDAWLNRIHPEDIGLMEGAVELHRKSTDPIRYEYRIRHSNGGYLYWSDNALPLLNSDNKPYKWVGVCTDITDLKRQQAQLEFNAYHDTLTGLPNRSLLSDRLRQAMRQQKRRGQHLMVVYIDLDGFKEVNDSYGHEVGDRLLVAIGRRFQQLLREGDTVARLGGDEFVAVLLDIDSVTGATPLIKRLLQSASQPVMVDDLTLQVSASLGISVYPQTEDVDADQLVRQADQAMYQAKLGGKNRYSIFDTEHDRSLRGQRESLERSERALDNGEFELYYQPKVNMRTGEVIGAEALIRWNHPERGLIPPIEFLPVIEDQPLAIKLGEWVIDTALTQIESWRAVGLDMPVSVNLGGLQLQQTDFVERLQARLQAHPGVTPGHLQLEVLESSALQDMVQVSRVIKECQKIGVSFALDDFGTGYSSLTYLKNLPAKVLKIDQSFVRNMLDDPDDLAILEGIMGMSSAFRREVIAEGVEGIEHGVMLLQLGCENAQGYAIARPMPAADFPAWAAQWRSPEVWCQQERIPPENLSLLFAIIEHRAWIKVLNGYLHQRTTVLPEMATSDCRFGYWLKHEGRERFGGSDFYALIVALHDQIHYKAEESLELLEQGQYEQAQATFRSVCEHSQELAERLKVLLNQRCY